MITIGKEHYLKAAQVFHWASKEHYGLWFTGKLERHHRTEVMLPRLVQKGKLVALEYGKRIVYRAPIQCRGKALFVEHGLACTEGLVRTWRARMDGLIIAERFFKGLGCVPEWGIRYPSGTLLLYEHCTQNNFEHGNMLLTKLAKYRRYLPAIEGKFSGTGIVLFVLDVSRERVLSFVNRVKPEGPFLFTDYTTFKSVPIGDQLAVPIYVWGEDGQSYPLEGRYDLGEPD